MNHFRRLVVLAALAVLCQSAFAKEAIEFRFIPSTTESPGYVYFMNVRGGWSSNVGSWLKLRDGADQEVKEFLGHQEMIK